MPVRFFSENTGFQPRHKRSVRQWIESTVLITGSTVGDINFIFCSDPYLLQMNREHLKHDYYTDVITFDYCSGRLISGDIFISIDRVRDNARKLKISSSDELHRVMVHGVLHLLGHSDKTASARKRMSALEDQALSLLHL